MRSQRIYSICGTSRTLSTRSASLPDSLIPTKPIGSLLKSSSAASTRGSGLMRPYDVYIHFALLDSVPKSGRQREMIMAFIRSLRKFPDTAGDFTDKDATQRLRQIKIVGDYAITFWLDAP